MNFSLSGGSGSKKRSSSIRVKKPLSAKAQQKNKFSFISHLGLIPDAVSISRSDSSCEESSDEDSECLSYIEEEEADETLSEKQEFSIIKDIVLIIFVCIQECDDTSYYQTIESKAEYNKSTLIIAVISVTLFLNFSACLYSHLLSRFFMSQNEGHWLGCILIYFICAYEFVFNIITYGAQFFDLK